MANIEELLVMDELIKKLLDNGQGKLVDVLLSNEAKVYTRKGKLNKCGACRILGWKTKQLEEALAECRRILTEE